MHILLSNDDGVYSPGIRILYDYLSRYHKVSMIAPDRDLSAASNSLTVNRPIRIQEIENGFISVEGTPTDCVHLALSELMKDSKPDLVIAGINAGSNLGDDVFYSGTVAAATEGYFFGVPSIAISQSGPPKEDTLVRTADYFTKFLGDNLDNILEQDTILNINFPSGDIKGIDVTRLGARHRISKMIKENDPRGKEIYWVGPVSPENDAGPGTDFYSINQSNVSVTPLQMDLTRYNALDDIAKWVVKK
ncbi:MAG: 5'/3'-nucleotidase SurE [Francisellaceae bacterium]|jgi:5'-nucleotidase|nr:5'/3'-nucleotidase SurE [Francisellaceae bacterium]MBT6207519.1 5'/3'-nucleotidase SurE [Francisellaceae bacterium]MBT6537982.1 5'/3'-nucleotidase SurE [Francisellaceae bacterium]